MNLLDAIARSLAAEPSAELAKRKALLYGTSVARPILQISRFPMTLDPSRFEDALSPSNPDGDQLPLFEFRQLVDPIPRFTRYYSASERSLEGTYGMIANGASARASNSFAQGVVSAAKQQFLDAALPSPDGAPGRSWRPVYSVPEDWYTASASGRFRELQIDLDAPQGDDSPFVTLDSSPTESSPLEAGSTIRAVTMKYLLIGLRRPWLSDLLLDLDDWYLGTQPGGYCSSGRPDHNAGVLPLIPTGLLVAKDVQIDARGSPGDPAALGPLAPSAGGSASTLKVIGWLSSLVPYSPRASGQSSGWITVKNKGGFFARFSASWREADHTETRQSRTFPVLGAETIAIPEDARSISVKIEMMTAPLPETWGIIEQYQFPSPVQKTYELSGKTWNPQAKEVSP